MDNYRGLPSNIFGRNIRSSANNKDENSYTSSSSDDEELKGYADCNCSVKSYQNKSKHGSIKFSSNKILSLDIIHKIEKELDVHDTISLVFLLYESQVALNVILTILSAGPHNFSRDFLSKWALSNPPNWCIALIEALTIIQNYKILTKLGYSKTEIKYHFNSTKNVDKIKKILYLLCEFLTKDQSKELIERVRRDVSFYNDITNKYSACLEFHLLLWISHKYLTIEQDISLSNLTKHLTFMGFLDKVIELENVQKSSNIGKQLSFCSQDIDAYPIKDPKNVGVCVIVNMALFKKNVEKRKDLKHLLPPEPLDDREGSLMDVKNLKDTFTSLKFLVVEVHNLFHYHLESNIQSIITEKFKKNVHSILVLCILSHGDKGVVYAANSIPVKLQHIQNIISGPTPIEDLLANIPKVIIIQACQGQNPLFVELKPSVQDQNENVDETNQFNFDGSHPLHLNTHGLVFDGPQRFSPKYADVLTCLAIIEGFVAVRSVKEGTKYIQELCQCLNKYYKKDHLLDIITRVHNNLNSKAIHVPTEIKGQFNCPEHTSCLCVYMTPEAKHTLRKKLYLTPSAINVPLQLL